ncbi:MAG: ATP-binding protein, partial [Candidatus Hodarchaeota archaeon]
ATSALGEFSPFIDEKVDPTHSITGDSVVLGARGAVHREVDGLLYLGRVTEHAPEVDKYGYAIQVDATFPHVVLIAGMRGSGKSYTLGVLAEELARTDIGIGVIIVDPLGVFWSMKLPNSDSGERKLIEKWHLVPNGHPEKVKVFIPLGYYEDYPEESKDTPFAIAPTELEAGDWAFMFKIDLQSPMGLLLRQAVIRVQKGYQSAREGSTILVPGKGEKYTIRDLIECISTDVDLISKERGFAKATRRALISRFMQVQSWGLFSSDQATPIHEISKPGQVSVIDVSFLSTVEPGSVALVVGLLARRILQERIRIGRAEESAYLTGTQVESDQSTQIPITWLMVDEAHMLVPEGERTAASQPLIEFAKQGRKPGCGLILATQRPAATSDQVLSQVDLVLCHALVLEDDLRALLKRTPAKLPQEFKSPDFIRTLPVGAAIVADQRTPLRSLVARTRPRTSSHAGKAAIPSKIMRAVPFSAVEPPSIEQGQRVEKKEIPMDTTSEPVEVQPSPTMVAPSIEPELMASLPPTTELPPAVIQGYLSRKLLYGFKDFFFPSSRAHRTTETGYIALQKDQWQAVQEVIRSEGWTLKSSMEQEDIAILLWETLRGKLGFATIHTDGRVQAVWAYVGTDPAEVAFLEEYNNP